MNAISATIPSNPDKHRSALMIKLRNKPRVVKRPTALPFGTRVRDAKNTRFVRDQDGLYYHCTRSGITHGSGLGAFDLTYPLTIQS